MAAFCLQDMPGSPLRNPAPRVPAAAPVANAGGGRGRGTRNRDVAAFHNPMYNEVSINVVSAAAGAASMRSLRPAHVSSSSIGAAFGVGARVEIVDKGAGTVRFVGLHHVEGTYGNSST